MVVTDSSITMIRGHAALDYPDVLSPVGLAALPPYFLAVPSNTFTNYQYALANTIRGLTFGGTYAPSPAAVTPRYSDGPRIVDLLANTPPYIPYQWTYDNTASRCESADYPVTFDDHLGEVTVPIFAISRRQSPSTDAIARTGSTDATTVFVNPLFNPALYGHGDFFLANDAASMVWRPILDWILARR